MHSLHLTEVQKQPFQKLPSPGGSRGALFYFLHVHTVQMFKRVLEFFGFFSLSGYLDELLLLQ